MKIFRIFNQGNSITTRRNKDNVYLTLKGAKLALRYFLKSHSRKTKTPVSVEDCEIIEYELFKTNSHKL